MYTEIHNYKNSKTFIIRSKNVVTQKLKYQKLIIIFKHNAKPSKKPRTN